MPPAANYFYEIRSDGGATSGRSGSIEATAGGNRLVIKDELLTANGKSYGRLKAGDRVLLDKDGTVYVNSEKRQPE
jgi:hypothetical protein